MPTIHRGDRGARTMPQPLRPCYPWRAMAANAFKILAFLLFSIACSREPALQTPPPAQLPEANDLRQRTAAVSLRFENGPIEWQDPAAGSDRLSVAAVFADVDRRDLDLLGIIPRDEAVATAVRRRKPLATGTESPALTALKGIAAKLRGITWV